MPAEVKRAAQNIFNVYVPSIENYQHVNDDELLSNAIDEIRSAGYTITSVILMKEYYKATFYKIIVECPV